MRQRKFKSLDGWHDAVASAPGWRRRFKFVAGGTIEKFYHVGEYRFWAEDRYYWIGGTYEQRTRYREWFMSDLLKRAIAARNAAKKKAAAIKEEDWFKALRTIEAMLKTTVMDGKKRATATLTFSVDGDQCKVCLKDREQHEVTWGSGDTFAEAMLGLEARLAEGTAEWQEDRFWKAGNGKK